MDVKVDRKLVTVTSHVLYYTATTQTPLRFVAASALSNVQPTPARDTQGRIAGGDVARLAYLHFQLRKKGSRYQVAPRRCAHCRIYCTLMLPPPAEARDGSCGSCSTSGATLRQCGEPIRCSAGALPMLQQSRARAYAGPPLDTGLQMKTCRDKKISMPHAHQGRPSVCP
jgi:hypothetical protein